MTKLHSDGYLLYQSFMEEKHIKSFQNSHRILNEVFILNMNGNLNLNYPLKIIIQEIRNMLKKKDSGVISSRSNSLLHEKLCTHSKRGVSPSSQMPYIRRPTAYDHLHSNTQSVSPDLGCETAPSN